MTQYPLRCVQNESLNRTSTPLESWTVKLAHRQKDDRHFAQIGPSLWDAGQYDFGTLGMKITQSDQTYRRQFHVVGGQIMVRQKKGHKVLMKGVVPVTDPWTLQGLQESIEAHQRYATNIIECKKSEARCALRGLKAAPEQTSRAHVNNYEYDVYSPQRPFF